MEATGELAWFRGEIWRALVRPREFAASLAREHYGLAGVLVALVAGVGLSIGIDLMVLASKGIAPGPFVPRMVIDALLLSVRLAVTAAAVSWIALGAVRLAGAAGHGTLDQLFTALTFSLSPLVLVPLAGVLVTVAATNETLALAAAVVLALVVRVLIGLALNIRSILSPPVAALVLAIVVILGTFVLGDQVSRMRFLTYAVAPQIVGELAAVPATGKGSVVPATGKRYDMLGFDLTVPAGWQIASGGIAGEAGRFESSTSTLRVLRARGAALSTADSYADIVAGPERVGLKDSWQIRSVTRINGVVVVDDQYGGTYEGRHVVWRQFTAVPGSQGLALLYRVVEPANDQAALDEAASIAATWHITAQGR
jgi:hypothetical protein